MRRESRAEYQGLLYHQYQELNSVRKRQPTEDEKDEKRSSLHKKHKQVRSRPKTYLQLYPVSNEASVLYPHKVQQENLTKCVDSGRLTFIINSLSNQACRASHVMDSFRKQDSCQDLLAQFICQSAECVRSAWQACLVG